MVSIKCRRFKGNEVYVCKKLWPKISVVVEGQAELLQVVDTLGPPGRLARRLHGRQQQGD